jgi:hypothetical protein
MERAIRAEPELAVLLLDVRSKLRHDEYPKHIVDAISQPYTDERSLEDIYGFCRVWSLIQQGHLCVCVVGCDEDPHRDRSPLNQPVLDKLLPPFGADVDYVCTSGGNSDGVFWWDEPIVFDRFFCDQREDWTCRPSAIALEIGSTYASCTLMHVLRGGVARWPHGHDRITVLMPHPDAPGRFIWGPRPEREQLDLWSKPPITSVGKRRRRARVRRR